MALSMRAVYSSFKNPSLKHTRCTLSLSRRVPLCVKHFGSPRLSNRFYCTDTRKGLVSDETLDKLKKFDAEETEHKRSFRSVGATVGGQKVVRFNGVKDMQIGRWYKDVTVAHVPENDKWAVYLDDRSIVTHTEKGLFLPTEEIARLVASEWEIQNGTISLSIMPLMSLACRAIDDMPNCRDYYHYELLDFLGGDHVCFRDEDVPSDYSKQMELHQPIVDWLNNTIGLKLDISKGFNVPQHPGQTTNIIDLYSYTLDNFTFHLFHSLVHATKSVATALALWHGAISVDHAIASVLLEENINVQTHGEIEGIHDLKKIRSSLDIMSATILLKLSGIPPLNKETINLLGDPATVLNTLQKEDWNTHKKLIDDLFVRLEENAKKETSEHPGVLLAALRERKELIDEKLQLKMELKQSQNKQKETFEKFMEH